MKNFKNYSKGILALIATFFVSNASFAASTSESSGWSNTTMFYILVAVAILIIVGILFVANSIKALIGSDYYKGKIYETENKKRGGGKNAALTIMALFAIPFASFSQTAEGVVENTDMSSTMVWAMVIVCLVLLGVVFFLKGLFTNLANSVKPEKFVTKKDGSKVKVKEKNKLTQLLTDTVSLEEEDSILMDHEYDGIQELDNNLPPWWIWSFYASIVFAFVYFFHYQVFKTGDSQKVEYEKTIIAGDKEVAAFLKTQNLNVDENSVVLLTESKDVKAGKAIFDKKCFACHGVDGGGTIGPNLTDDYWIHGGDIKDVFKLIKYGNPSKGMQAWGEELNPVEIQQVSSFVKSLKGTLEEGKGKAAQGELYTEDGGVKTADSTVEVVEETMVALTDKKSLEEGKKVYDLNCFACHGTDLGGIVGPNLTDNAWIYGGKTAEIVHLIETGATKGMAAWMGTISDEQILQVASYILSKQGSKPANGKAPEGEVLE